PTYATSARASVKRVSAPSSPSRVAAVCGPTPGMVCNNSASKGPMPGALGNRDRKSTRLNSSHVSISYAVFCLKKKKKKNKHKRKKTKTKKINKIIPKIRIQLSQIYTDLKINLHQVPSHIHLNDI